MGVEMKPVAMGGCNFFPRTGFLLLADTCSQIVRLYSSCDNSRVLTTV